MTAAYLPLCSGRSDLYSPLVSNDSLTSMTKNLDNMLGDQEHPNLKSEGERRIAYFLEGNSIRYHYEPGVMVNSADKKPRIWYPDFYLPEFGTYIEYFGLVGRQSYDRGIKTKEATYSKMGLAVIPIYPWRFAENWQGYIMKELERITIGRYMNLTSKPYWSRHKSATYQHVTSAERRYPQGLNKPY